MALSPAAFDFELTKNTIGGIAQRARKKLSELSSPPDKIAPNIYGENQESPQIPQSSKPQDPQGTVRGVLNSDLRQPQVPTSAQPTPTAKPTQPGQFKATLRGGIIYSADDQGNRTFTMGTPGQDGYGMVKTRAGSETEPVARQPMPRPTVQTPMQAQPSIAPIQRDKTPLEISMENSDRMKGPANQQTYGPRYLSREEGDAMGLGWKGRLAKYKEDVEMFNRQAGNQAAMDLEQMREVGAGRRALLTAQGVNDANVIARQRVVGDNAMNAARIATEGINQQKGMMELDQAKNLSSLQQQYLGEKDPIKQKALGNQLLTLQGKDPKQWQVTTREEADPSNPIMTRKVSYAVNLNDPTQTIEIGGGQMTQRIDAPQAAIDHLKKNPGLAASFKQKYGYLPDGFR